MNENSQFYRANFLRAFNIYIYKYIFSIAGDIQKKILRYLIHLEYFLDSWKNIPLENIPKGISTKYFKGIFLDFLSNIPKEYL